MKFYININQKFAVEHGLNTSEAIVFAWLYELPSWAKSVLIDNKTYYFASENKAAEEMPLISDKKDTFYRLYKSLAKKGLIEILKIGKATYIAITDLGKGWYLSESSQKNGNSEHLNNYPNSENNSDFAGNSEESRKILQNNSEIAPTNNIYKNNNTNNNIYRSREKEFSRNSQQKGEVVEAEIIEPKEPKGEGAKRLFRSFFPEIDKGTYDELNALFNAEEYADINLVYYYNAVADWSDSANKKRTKRGWIATIRNFIKSDKEKNKLHTISAELFKEQIKVKPEDYLTLDL